MIDVLYYMLFTFLYTSTITNTTTKPVYQLLKISSGCSCFSANPAHGWNYLPLSLQITAFCDRQYLTLSVWLSLALSFFLSFSPPPSMPCRFSHWSLYLHFVMAWKCPFFFEGDIFEMVIIKIDIWKGNVCFKVILVKYMNHNAQKHFGNSFRIKVNNHAPS